MTCNLSAQFIHSRGRSGVAVLNLSLLVEAAVELRAAFVRPFVRVLLDGLSSGFLVFQEEMRTKWLKCDGEEECFKGSLYHLVLK